MKKPKKKVVFPTGGKGGTGKSTVVISLAEWYQENHIPCTLLDLDTENKKKGSLSHFFPDRAAKIDINTPAGLDTLIDQADKEPDVILADMGAGSGKVSTGWFDSMYESVADILAFTAIGVVTSDPASVESLLNWAAQLQDRVSYLIVLNQQEDQVEDFTYWEKTTEAIAFRDVFHPPVIRMASRLPDLQHALRNHGCTLGKVINRETAVAELAKSSLVVRAQAYRRQLSAEFNRVKEALLP
jgi:MinD-like ATPase involved in chromosome partitioning or flagellar assembly